MAFRDLSTSMTQSNLGVINGAQLSIIIFVLSQFVEFTLFRIGNFDVSLQKILALVLYPFALLIMRKLRLNTYLLVFGCLLLASYTTRLFIEGQLDSILAVTMIIMSGFFSAMVLYNALATNLDEKLGFLAQVWIFFGVVTAIITVLESLRIIPLITVPENMQILRDTNLGFVRGVGLKSDPNFQSLVLSLSIPFIFIYTKKKFLIVLYTAIIISGVIATFSRMGLILIALVIVLMYFQIFSKVRFVIVSFIVCIIFAIIYLFLLPPFIKGYLTNRYIDSYEFIYTLTTGRGSNAGDWISSAVARAIVLRAGFILGVRNLPFGIGAFQSQNAIFIFSGVNNVVHNTYIELFLQGGIIGILTVLAYLFVLFSSSMKIIRAKVFNKYSVLLINVVVIGAGLFLSLSYNSILWLPLVLSLTVNNYMKQRNS